MQDPIGRPRVRAGVTLVLASVLALGTVSCSARTRQTSSAKKDAKPGENDARVAEFDLTSGMPEGAAGGFVQVPAARTYTGLVRALERTADNTKVSAVFVRLAEQGIDFSRSREIGELLGRMRDKGRPVVCHAHTLTNSTTWLLSRGCSRIWLSAAGSVETVGIAAQLVHLKGMLDKLKLSADFLAVGKFKSGPEPLLREEPSEAAKEALSSTLSSMRSSWLQGADSGRPGKSLKEKLERGPYSPEEAKQQELIDAIGFESEAREEAKKLGKTRFIVPSYGPAANKGGGLDIGEIVRTLAGVEDEGKDKPHIAVIPAEGAISMNAGGPLDDGGITAKALGRTIKRAAENDAVKAVVLRIDSPGGSPLASDLIWHELMELRKKKPVVASVGSMAASGGYYIACGAQKIVAESTSIVGSIGVFGGKIVIGPALHEVGINAFTVPANPDPAAAARATYLSPFAPWDDATRDRMRAHMQSIYDLFIARIVEARKIPEGPLREHAEGRIWSGVQGQELGLVDEIGGLSKALELVRNLAGLSKDTPVTIEGSKDGLMELLGLGDDAEESQVRAAILALQRRQALLAELPSEWRAGAAAVAGPLLSGEGVVAAAPIGIRIH